jgi:CTP-dependent riboflavin kinase
MDGSSKDDWVVMAEPVEEGVPPQPHELLNVPMMRIAVGQAHGPHRCMINHDSIPQQQWDAGESMTRAGWTHQLEFHAFRFPIPGTIRIAVGQAHEPHRCMINHDSIPQEQWDAGESMTRAGWTHQLEFHAFRFPIPGTIRIAVGQAHEPHRCMINHDSIPQEQWDAGESMTRAGWTHQLEFYAFKEARPGTIRIAVGQAGGPHRCMINHDSIPQEQWDAGESMTRGGWTHQLEFWAFPQVPAPMMRIAVGQAHGPHRCMINHDSIPQEQWDAGESMTRAGWTHQLEFHAFRFPIPGTIRIAVGQAHEPHRCMINHDSIPQEQWDAGESMTRAGWTHQLEFHAFRFPIPGTIRIAVGQAHEPHRCMINHDSIPQEQWDAGESMTRAGWTHQLEFYAFKEARPGTIRIAVGQAGGPHRCMINHDSIPQEQWDAGESMTRGGWTHQLEFWVFP